MTSPPESRKLKRLRTLLGRLLGALPESGSPLPQQSSSSCSLSPENQEDLFQNEVILRGVDPEKGHQIVDSVLAANLRSYLPPRLQLFDEWDLIYSTNLHGILLNTLYRNSDPETQIHQFCNEHGQNKVSSGYADNVVKGIVVISSKDVTHHQRRHHGYILAIEDQKGNIFGCFLNEHLRATDKKRYYGNGECFLWKSEWTKEAPALSRRLKAFVYTGINDNIIYSNHEFIAVGSSSGNNGLWIDKSLCLGVSYKCDTFENEILNERGESDRKYGKFKIMNLEVWRVGPLQR